MINMRYIALCGLLLLCLVWGVSAQTTWNFQNDAPGWSSAGTLSLVPYTYADTYQLKEEGLQNLYSPATITNTLSFTAVPGWADGSHSIGVLNTTGYSMGGFAVLPTNGRVTVTYTGNMIHEFLNGTEISNASTSVPGPIGYLQIHDSHTPAVAYIEDYSSDSSDVVGGPPHNWFIAKDMINPSVFGLFNPSYAQVYSTTMHVSYGSTTPNQTIYVDGCDPVNTTGYGGIATINISPILNTTNYGIYNIKYGTANDYITYQAVTLVTTNIGWNKSSYALGDIAGINYSISSQYWDTSTYDYKIKVINYYPNGTSTTLQTIPLTASTGNVTYTTATTSSALVAALIADLKSSPNSDIWLAQATTTVVNGIYVSGHTFDGFVGLPLSGVTVTVQQSGTNYTTTSDSNGAWNISQLFNTGTIMYFWGTKTSYSPATFNYTWTTPGTLANIDLSLMPNVVSVPNSTPVISHNGTALGGYVEDSGGHYLPGALVTNGVVSYTSSAAGIWLLDNLNPQTEYTVTCSLAGYVPVSKVLSTGEAGTITYYNFILYPASGVLNGTTLGGYAFDASTGFTIPTVSVNLSNITWSSLTSTSAQGYYQFGQLGAGESYTLNASKTGYANASGSATTGAPNTITYYNFYMAPSDIGDNGTSSGSAIAGQVVDATTLTAITTANMTLSNGTYQVTGSSTAPNGIYLFDNLTANSQYSITANATGYTAQTKTATTLSGSSISYCNFYLVPNTNASINGTGIYGFVLATPFNTPVSGATVTAGGQTTTTNTGGYYSISNLNPSTSYTATASATGYSSGSSTVSTGSYNSATRADIYLSQSFTVTVDVWDSTTNSLVPNAIVSVNNAQQTNTSNGVATFNLQYGSYTFSASATGYYAGSATGTVANDQTVNIYLTPAKSEGSQNQNLIYTPHLVRMYFIDEFGNRLSNLAIVATPTGQISVPSNWLNDILGLPVNASMPTTTLTGTTASDGSISFLMVEVIQYGLVASGYSPINNASINQSVIFYPKDTDYWIKINTGLQPNLSSAPEYNLTVTQNGATVDLGMNYSDPAGLTSNLTFYVIKNNGTIVYSTTLGSMGGTATYAAANTRGDIYTFGFNATNPNGENNVLQAWQDVTMHGPAVLFDFGLDSTTRMWIAMGSIFLFMGIWGTTTIKQGVFLTPFFAGGFWTFVGWLPATMWGLISILSFMGGLIYMRAQETKVLRS